MTAQYDQTQFQAPLTEAVELELVESFESEAVENVWQNKLVSLLYLTLAAVVSYALVVTFVMLET